MATDATLFRCLLDFDEDDLTIMNVDADGKCSIQDDTGRFQIDYPCELRISPESEGKYFRVEAYAENDKDAGGIPQSPKEEHIRKLGVITGEDARKLRPFVKADKMNIIIGKFYEASKRDQTITIRVCLSKK